MDPPSQAVPPHLPTAACLLVSAQSCAAQLEGSTTGFQIRARLCVCVCVWLVLLSVNNTSGGGCCQPEADMRAKAVT